MPIPPGAEVPRNVRDAMAQKKQVKRSMGTVFHILNWGVGVDDVFVGHGTGSVRKACIDGNGSSKQMLVDGATQKCT